MVSKPPSLVSWGRICSAKPHTCGGGKVRRTWPSARVAKVESSRLGAANDHHVAQGIHGFADVEPPRRQGPRIGLTVKRGLSEHFLQPRNQTLSFRGTRLRLYLIDLRRRHLVGAQPIPHFCPRPGFCQDFCRLKRLQVQSAFDFLCAMTGKTILAEQRTNFSVVFGRQVAFDPGFLLRADQFRPGDNQAKENGEGQDARPSHGLLSARDRWRGRCGENLPTYCRATVSILQGERKDNHTRSFHHLPRNQSASRLAWPPSVSWIQRLLLPASARPTQSSCQMIWLPPCQAL